MSSLADKVLANRRFDFSSQAPTSGGGTYAFAVVEMEGFEALSQPFRFTLTLVSDDASVDFDAMLNHPATFTIYGPQGRTATPYHGVLAEFEQMHSADGYVFYRAVLVPRAWNLSLYRISEVYLDEQPVTETLKTVLKNGGLTTSDFDFRLTGDYRPRSFICQYEETHLDFVSRWMEHEGIYYYFDHRSGVDRLIAVDSVTMHEKSRVGDGDETKVVPVVYRPDDRMNTGVSGDGVRLFVGRQKPLPREVILQDFNHRKAAVQLKASASVSDNGRGEVMIYGEDFRTEDEGKRYAKLRAEQILCAGRVFSGEGSAAGLRAGYFAALSGHYRDDFNAEYLVTEIHHQGSQAGALLSGIRSPYSDGGAGGETSYHNSFRAIASKVQFRPERVTPKPRVSGTMNATVDSEGSGEYAELDEYGQYKVQLPFDLTDKRANKGSARVRMATPYAGSDHGMHFPLLKGAEVLLSFTDGDPDRPVIVGAVPNSENRSIVDQANAHENRITTAAGNQLCMGDSRGKQVIWLHSPFHNSSIGIGSTDPKGGGSIWQSTSGSIESIAVGTKNTVSAGITNTCSLGYASTLSASVSNTISLGFSNTVSYSQSTSWTTGRKISIDDSESMSLSTEGKLQANKSTTISGGQRADISAAVTALKSSVKKATILSAAVQAAAAASAATAIQTVSDANQSGTDWNNGLQGAQGALGATVQGIALYTLVYRGAAKTIADALKADSTHASNVVVDGVGIKMTVADPAPGANLPVPPTANPSVVTRTLEMNQGGVKIDVTSAAGTSPITLSASSTAGDAPISITATSTVGDGPVTITGTGTTGASTLTLGQTGVDLSANSAAAAAKFSTPSGMMQINATEVLIQHGTATVAADGQNGVMLDYAQSQLLMLAAETTLKSPTVKINGSAAIQMSTTGTATVNGQLIQLG